MNMCIMAWSLGHGCIFVDVGHWPKGYVLYGKYVNAHYEG